MSYRLNRPAGDESTMLLSVPDYQLVTARPVPERDGRPIVGVDLGGGRAWSAAAAVWRNGRTECLAIAPGLPNIEAQERRDRVTGGAYRRLIDLGLLHVATGKRVPPPAVLMDRVRAWNPEVVLCDRFRLPELLDCTGDLPVVARATRDKKDAAADVRSLRRLALDGPLSLVPSARPLMEASLAVAKVTTDGSGNTFLQKRGSNNESRDDVCAAWLLAAGALDRAPPTGSGSRLITA